MRQPLATMPGFEQSLYLLLRVEQYTLHDVGMMFNVTRERIRQLAERYGIPYDTNAKGLLAVRVWDDEAHRFLPVPRAKIRRDERRASTEAWQNSTKARIASRRARMVAALRACADSLGRAPSIQEMAQAVFPDEPRKHTLPAAAGWLTAEWGGRGSGVFAAIRAATGFGARPVGVPGHLTIGKRKRQTHCLRGHEFSEANTYWYKGRFRHCRACGLMRSKASRARPLGPNHPGNVPENLDRQTGDSSPVAAQRLTPFNREPAVRIELTTAQRIQP